MTNHKTFKKSINKNGGSGFRGIVQIDITAPSEELADKMVSLLVDAGFEFSECGDDLGLDGYLVSMMVPSNEVKDFNFLYTKFKKELCVNNSEYT